MIIERAKLDMKKRYLIPIIIIGVFGGLIALGFALNERTLEGIWANMGVLFFQFSRFLPH